MDQLLKFSRSRSTSFYSPYSRNDKFTTWTPYFTRRSFHGSATVLGRAKSARIEREQDQIRRFQEESGHNKMIKIDQDTGDVTINGTAIPAKYQRYFLDPLGMHTRRDKKQTKKVERLRNIQIRNQQPPQRGSFEEEPKEPFSKRQLRVAELLRSSLQNLFAMQVVDNDVLREARVNIDEVQMSKDMRHATIYWTVLRDGTRPAVEKELAKEKVVRHIRGLLAKNVSFLKFSPELVFQNGLPFEIAENKLDGYLKIIGDSSLLMEDIQTRTERKRAIMEAFMKRQSELEKLQELKDQEAEIQVMASPLNARERAEEEEILKAKQIIRPEMKTPDAPPLSAKEKERYTGMKGKQLKQPKMYYPSDFYKDPEDEIETLREEINEKKKDTKRSEKDSTPKPDTPRKREKMDVKDPSDAPGSLPDAEKLESLKQKRQMIIEELKNSKGKKDTSNLLKRAERIRQKQQAVDLPKKRASPKEAVTQEPPSPQTPRKRPSKGQPVESPQPKHQTSSAPSTKQNIQSDLEKAIREQILKDQTKRSSPSSTTTHKVKPSANTVSKRKFHTTVINLCTKKEGSLFQSMYREQAMKIDPDYGKSVQELTNTTPQAKKAQPATSPPKTGSNAQPSRMTEILQKMKGGQQVNFTQEDLNQILQDAGLSGSASELPVENLIKEFEENKESWSNQMGISMKEIEHVLKAAKASSDTHKKTAKSAEELIRGVESQQSKRPITTKEAHRLMKRVHQIEFEFDKLRDKKARGELTEKDNKRIMEKANELQEIYKVLERAERGAVGVRPDLAHTGRKRNVIRRDI